MLPGYLAAVPSAAAAGVGQWDRFEAAVTNAKRYADPYKDVTLDVTYTRPDGETVRFWGFYDGGTTWKIRFMPDQIGTWRYEATFSDGSQGMSGTFTCVPSTLPGMISRDETNPRWFGFRGGKHALIRSFHVGDRFFAENWDAAKRAAFLDWAQKQGYNLLSVASHYLNRDAEGRGRGWRTPRLWPLDAAEYRKMEAVLDDLARRRLLVYPFAGFFGRDSDYPRQAADQSRYISYTLARLGAYWNILLNVAGPEPNLKGKPYMTAEEVARLGEEIKTRDVFGHLLGVHNRTGDDPYKDAAWASYGTLQGPKTTDLSALSRGLLNNHHASRPLYAQETLWSGNKNHPNYTDKELRKNAYVINLSAAALNFADNDPDLSDGAGGDSSGGFSGTMDLADRRQGRHDIVRKVWDFFESVAFWRMRPRQDLVSNGFCLAEEGEEYLVYLETPGAVSVKVAEGTYTVQWINAQDTSDRRSAGTTTSGDNLRSPTEGEDWLLRLVSASRQASAPASPHQAPAKVAERSHPGLTADAAARAGDYTFSVKGEKTYLNGQEIRVKGLRASNALLSEDATKQLIDSLDTFQSYGVNTVSVYFMGSRFGDVKGYNEDATLSPVHAERMGRIIEAADKRGMIVLVGCLYWGNSQAKWESWQQAQANAAVANTVRWLKEKGYRNVFLDVDNEGMARAAKGFDNRAMVQAGKAVDPAYVIGTNFKGDPPPEADIALHFSNKVPGKPYIESEATPDAPGGYWGSYSKKPGYYNYINIGIYFPETRKTSRSDKRRASTRLGYLMASTWLQRFSRTGRTSGRAATVPVADPGIRWWLEYLRDKHGALCIPPAKAGASARYGVFYEQARAIITAFWARPGTAYMASAQPLPGPQAEMASRVAGVDGLGACAIPAISMICWSV